jgi:hypothetical protein
VTGSSLPWTPAKDIAEHVRSTGDALSMKSADPVLIKNVFIRPLFRTEAAAAFCEAASVMNAEVNNVCKQSC